MWRGRYTGTDTIRTEKQIEQGRPLGEGVDRPYCHYGVIHYVEHDYMSLMTTTLNT